MLDKLLTEIIRWTDGEQILSFNNSAIQSQQIQDVYASKSRMVGKLLKYLPK